MKTLSLLIALLVCPSLLIADSDSEPVSEWNFNGTLSDSHGQSNDTLAVPGKAAEPRFVSSSDLPGVKGKAIALGVKPNDIRSLSASTSADVSLGPNYTIEAWIYPTQISEWNRLVLRWSMPKDFAYHLAIHKGKASLYHGLANGRYLYAEGGIILPGQWYHLVGIARRNNNDPAKSQLEVYLNGKKTASAMFDGTTATLTNQGLGVGNKAGNTGTAQCFHGYIDHLTIWNRALEPADIKTRFNPRAELVEKSAVNRRKTEIEKRAAFLADIANNGVKEIIFSERGPGLDYQPNGKGVPGHYYANFGYACMDPDFWFHCDNGSRLIKLNIETNQLTVLLDEPKGAIRDGQVHYDAKKILFSYRKNGSHHYNLYEIDIDGKNLKQLTFGPWDDIEPCYLPDGGIVFSSSRCKRYIGCWMAQTAILHRCDSDGSNIRMLSSNIVTENTPSVLPDGRVLYTRWEYVNRDPVVFHHLWTINPDGTNQQIYFGNMHPQGVFIDAKPIGQTDRVVFINSIRHGRPEHAGQIQTVTDNLGPDDRSAIKTVLDGHNLRDPYPITKDIFLAAQGNNILCVKTGPEVTIIHSSAKMLHEPYPVRKRIREKVIPSRTDLKKKTATLILSDVYNGRNMQGVKRGSIKKLLIMEDLPKPVNFHGGGSQPIGHGVTSTLKRILGTVPVEPDGSASFEVPPLRSIYFAALDQNDLSVKQMRSFLTLQPGETLSCVGCHEQRSKTPANKGLSNLQALGIAPSKIKPYKNVSEIIDFLRDVQPILDKHCIKCHNYEKRKGGVVLQGDRGPVYSQSYYSLILHWQVKDTAGDPKHGSGRQLGNDKPYACFSSASPLMKKIDGSHHKVNLNEHETRIIRLWLDTCT